LLVAGHLARMKDSPHKLPLDELPFAGQALAPRFLASDTMQDFDSSALYAKTAESSCHSVPSLYSPHKNLLPGTNMRIKLAGLICILAGMRPEHVRVAYRWPAQERRASPGGKPTVCRRPKKHDPL
jgi:hypothetical protein